MINSQSHSDEQTNEISLYSGNVELATKQQEKEYLSGVKDIVQTLMYSFSAVDKENQVQTSQPPQFYSVLTRMIFEKRIPLERVKAAAEHLLTTHKYLRFTIADFLSFDVKVRTYTRNEIYKACEQFPSSDFPLVRFPDGREAWVKLSDYNQHKVDDVTAEQIKKGEMPLVKSLLLIRDYKEYDT